MKSQACFQKIDLILPFVSLPDKVMVWQTFPVRGWILIVFMMGLGMTLKYIPEIPSAFTAAFYSGLGPMLFLSSVRFISNMK